MQIIAVRHGESVAGQKKVILGQNDAPLTESGRIQMSKVVPRLPWRSQAAIISSDLSRALQSAEIIAREISTPHILRMREFQERHYGILQGMTISDLRSVYPTVFSETETLLVDRIPGVELEVDFKARVLAGLKFLLKEFASQRVILVTHGGVIRLLYALSLDLPFDSVYYRIDPILNGSVHRFLVDSTGANHIKVRREG